MRLITKNDDEMLKTLILSARMSRRDKMSAYFKQKIENGDNPGDAWFYYGLNAWQMMNVTSELQEKHLCLVEVLKGFSEAVALEPLHWPALYLRCLIRIRMSGEEVDKRSFFPLTAEYTTANAHADLARLTDLQKATDPQPCFFATYALIASGQLEQGKTQAALETICEGLTQTPAGVIPFFAPLVSLSIKALIPRLPASEQTAVKERCRILFPGAKLS